MLFHHYFSNNPKSAVALNAPVAPECGGFRTVRLARRIVQIQGTSVFSVGPRSPILPFKLLSFKALYFELLEFLGKLESITNVDLGGPGEPSGSLGEPWGPPVLFQNSVKLL